MHETVSTFGVRQNLADMNTATLPMDALPGTLIWARNDSRDEGERFVRGIVLSIGSDGERVQAIVGGRIRKLRRSACRVALERSIAW